MRPKTYQRKVNKDRRVPLNCTVELWIFERVIAEAEKLGIGRSELVNRFLHLVYHDRPAPEAVAA